MMSMTGNSKQIVAITTAGVFWSISIALMVMASVAAPNWEIVAGWSLLSALWACMWTVWALLLEERLRVESICDLAYQGESEDKLRAL